jgi:HPt (histidine-containing phosphotransfer) domain-containing protein
MSDMTPELGNLISQSVVDEMVDLVGLDAYKRMLDSLARNTNSDLSQLITHLQQDDWDAIVSQAHKVKGAAGLLGLRGLQAACEKIGDQAKVNQKADDAEATLQHTASGNIALLKQTLG